MSQFFLNEQKKNTFFLFFLLNLLKIVCVLFLERKLVLEENLDTWKKKIKKEKKGKGRKGKENPW